MIGAALVGVAVVLAVTVLRPAGAAEHADAQARGELAYAAD